MFNLNIFLAIFLNALLLYALLLDLSFRFPTSRLLRLWCVVFTTISLTITICTKSSPLLRRSSFRSGVLARRNRSLGLGSAFGKRPAVFFEELALLDAEEGDADLDAFLVCALGLGF